MGRVIVIANQKGGVGKTTTSISLGACLAKIGKKVLLIDTDSQGNLATGLGLSPPPGKTIYEVMIGRMPIEDVVIATEWDNLYLVPSDVNLAAAELELVSEIYRETILKRKLGSIRNEYDFIILDSPPSLGLLTINNLSASDSVIIPLQCEYYALEGLSKLLDTVKLVMDNINSDLVIDGVLMTMYDARTRLSKRMVEEVKKAMGPLVFETIIPRTIKLAEAPDVGKPIIYYMPYHKGAKAYLALAEEIIERLGMTVGDTVPELPKDFAEHVKPGKPAKTPEPVPVKAVPEPEPDEPPAVLQSTEPEPPEEAPAAVEAPAPAESPEEKMSAITSELGEQMMMTAGIEEPAEQGTGEAIEKELDKLMAEVDTLSDRIEGMKKIDVDTGSEGEPPAPGDRKDEYKEDLRVLREQGYNIDKMLGLLDSDIAGFESRYPVFIDGVAKAEALRERLNEMDLPEGDKVKESILVLLSEPERVGEARRLTDELVSTLSKAETQAARPVKAPPAPERPPVPAEPVKRPKKIKPPEPGGAGIAATIAGWKAAGFDVSILEKIIATGNQAKVQKNFSVFEQRVERLNKMAAVVSRIKAPALQEEIDRLRPLLKDVTNYNEAKKIFQGIVDRVKKKA